MPHQLRNIPAVAVMPGGNLELGLHGLATEDMGATVELMLRMSGIHIIPACEATAYGAPLLCVTATALLVGNVWVTMLEVNLHDYATVMRNGEQGNVRTWGDSIIFAAEFNGLPDRLRLMLSNSLTRFANDLGAAQHISQRYSMRKPTAP